MRAIITMTLTAAAVLGGVRSASAQLFLPRDERVVVSINLGYQVTEQTFSTTTTAPLYQETATTTASYTVPKGKFFDGGILYRLAGSFAVGVSVSSYSEFRNAPVSGTVPHPFFFNTPRPLSGTANNLQHSETAGHVQIGLLKTSRRYDLAVTGGPTMFMVKQDLVASPVYAEVYPYDTVSLSSVTTTRSSQTAVGFNVGVDFSYKLSRGFGVGGLVRYAKASVSFPLTGSASSVSADAGGVQAGGGVRFFF